MSSPNIPLAGQLVPGHTQSSLHLGPPPYLYCRALSPCRGLQGMRSEEGTRKGKEGDWKKERLSLLRDRQGEREKAGDRAEANRTCLPGGGGGAVREGKGGTAQGVDEDGGSRFIRCCCGILVTSPSLPASSCNAAGRDGPGGKPPGCPSTPPGFRGTQGWVPVAAQRRGRVG